MKYLLLFFALITTGFTYGQEYNFSKVDEHIKDVAPLGPGVIVGVIKDDQLLHVSSKGLANLDYNIPIDANSNFRLSSTSKQFTAACILQLAEGKKLNLNDPLSKYFPDFSSDIGKVTVQHLLNHTSGIRDYMTLMMIQESKQMDFFNSFIGKGQDIMDLLNDQDELSFQSGTEHNYSNTNYWILAQIVERVSEQSIGIYAKEHLFDPLGMTATSYLETKGKVVSNRVSGYVSECPDCDRLEYRAHSEAVGDGGVVSSINDLLLWEQEFHNPKVLSHNVWDMLLTKGTLNNGEEISYAAGLIIEELDGKKVVKHSGQVPGFSSEILRFPDRGISIIVLGNQNWHDVNQIAYGTAELFFPAPAKEDMGQSVAEVTPVMLNTDQLDMFCGDYHYIETDEYRTIERKDNQLMYIRNNGPMSKLIPLSDNLLTFEDRPHITLTFTFDANGDKHIHWQAAMGDQHANSYTKETIQPKELQAYASVYRSNELNKDFAIAFENDKLVVSFFGQQLPLDIIKKDELSAMGMFKFRFERDASDEIVSFRMDAPRARDIEFRRVGG